MYPDFIAPCITSSIALNGRLYVVQSARQIAIPSPRRHASGRSIGRARMPTVLFDFIDKRSQGLQWLLLTPSESGVEFDLFDGQTLSAS